MLRWSVVFLVIAIISAMFGYIEALGAVDVAKFLFFLFLALFTIGIFFTAQIFKDDD